MTGNAIVLLAFACVPPLIGMAARARHPGLPSHELALPTVLMRDLPPLLGSLGLAAVVSAEASSADAILFMLATSLSQDLYRALLRPAATDAEILRVARVTAVMAGALGVGLAIVSPTVIGALSVFYVLLGVSLFVPVVAGLYLRRAGTPEALAAIAAGVAVMLAVQLATGGRGFGVVTPALAGLIASAAGCLLVLALRRQRAGL